MHELQISLIHNSTCRTRSNVCHNRCTPVILHCTFDVHWTECVMYNALWTITHFEKKSNLNLGPSQRTLKKNDNVLSTILWISRSFEKVLERYCLDKSGLHHANYINQFLFRFCERVSQTRFIGNSFLPLPDIFVHKFAKIKVLFLSYFRKNLWRISFVFMIME